MAANVVIERADNTFATVQCLWANTSSILLTYYRIQARVERLVLYPLDTFATLAEAWPASPAVYVWDKEVAAWQVGDSPETLSLLN